ncbi:IS66 family insertion sequence element accessory protein TnpA, partial [Gilvimarinus sp. DZF01]|uniref:IS66 family insertion sequence element accessory protein TnpA n=1 Tax=Gilvimarinus sp. DZF01 TaxID=3461371 RepID=UPI00404587DE
MTTAEKRSHWQRHVDAWQRSDLTQKAYCESQGISVATFGYWRKRLVDDVPQKKFVSLG